MDFLLEDFYFVVFSILGLVCAVDLVCFLGYGKVIFNPYLGLMGLVGSIGLVATAIIGKKEVRKSREKDDASGGVEK